MMLAHRKESKPTRFNLGGLIKRKMSWKRTIDAVLAAPAPVLVEPVLLPAMEILVSDDDITPYNCYTTECVLLLNSDMTLHNTVEEEYVPFVPAHEEPAHEYSAGGYYRVRLGDRLGKYTVVRKLGWGHFLTVWLAQEGEQYVAIKVVKLGRNYAEAARDEIRILRLLQKSEEIAIDGRVGTNAAATSNYSHYDINNYNNYTTNYPSTNHSTNYPSSEYSSRNSSMSSSPTSVPTVSTVPMPLSPPTLVQLLDDFEIPGPHGPHVAMVFEAMGENLLQHSLARKNAAARLPVDSVRHMTRQVLEALHYMHLRGVIHTDIKPENVVVHADIHQNVRGAHFQPSHSHQPTPPYGHSNSHSHTHLHGHLHGHHPHLTHLSSHTLSVHPFHLSVVLPSHPLRLSQTGPVSVKVVDLGNATPVHRHFSPHIQTRQYRAPEVILGHAWGALADVWLVGCLVFELLTGDYLFDPRDSPDFTKDDDHLAQVMELLGAFPLPLYLSQCDRAERFFSGPTELRHIADLRVWPLMDVLVEKYGFDRTDASTRLVVDFITKCLQYELADRYDCGSLLAHPWFHELQVFDQAEVDTLPNHSHQVRGFSREE